MLRLITCITTSAIAWFVTSTLIFAAPSCPKLAPVCSNKGTMAKCLAQQCFVAYCEYLNGDSNFRRVKVSSPVGRLTKAGIYQGAFTLNQRGPFVVNSGDPSPYTSDRIPFAHTVTAGFSSIVEYGQDRGFSCNVLDYVPGRDSPESAVFKVYPQPVGNGTTILFGEFETQSSR